MELVPGDVGHAHDRRRRRDGGGCRSLQTAPQVVRRGPSSRERRDHRVEVLSVAGNDVTCSVVVGGELRSHKGLNLPGIDLGMSAFTERDHECLKFAAGEGIDAVSQSFVETGEDIRAVRQAAEALDYTPSSSPRSSVRTRWITWRYPRRGGRHYDRPGRPWGGGAGRTDRPDAEGLMRKANRCAEPVITATQMLESMTTTGGPPAPRPPTSPTPSSTARTASCCRGNRPWEGPGGRRGDAGRDRGGH